MRHLRSKKAKQFVAQVDTGKCVGCGLCAKQCKRGALTIVQQEAGKHLAAVPQPQQCTACGKCVKRCHFNAIQLSERQPLANKNT